MHTTFDYSCTACASCLKLTVCARSRRADLLLPPSLVLCCCWAASEPMQPTPLLLSAEEGGRVSLTLVS